MSYQTYQPAYQNRHRQTRPMRRGGIGSGFSTAVTFTAVICTVHIVNIIGFGGNLAALGVQPRDTSSLWHILVAPFIHANSAHISSNAVPAAIFCFLIGMTGKRTWWEVTTIVTVVGGGGIWLFGEVGTSHVGASILIYGWFSYLVIRGIFNRSLTQIIVGILVGISYAGLVWGVLPGTPGISWEGHLFGAIGGVIAAMFITSDDRR